MPRVALHQLATREAATGEYFSPELLDALAQVLNITAPNGGLTQGAVEVLSGGLRKPEEFIDVTVQEGEGLDLADFMDADARARAARAPVRKLANHKGEGTSDRRKTVRDWRNTPSLSTASAMNKMASAAHRRHNMISPEAAVLRAAVLHAAATDEGTED